MIGRVVFSAKVALAVGLSIFKNGWLIVLVFSLPVWGILYLEGKSDAKRLAIGLVSGIVTFAIILGMFFLLHLLRLSDVPPGATRDDTIKDLVAKMDAIFK